MRRRSSARAATVALLLAGCAGAAEPPSDGSPTAATDADEPTTSTFAEETANVLASVLAAEPLDGQLTVVEVRPGR